MTLTHSRHGGRKGNRVYAVCSDDSAGKRLSVLPFSCLYPCAPSGGEPRALIWRVGLYSHHWTIAAAVRGPRTRCWTQCMLFRYSFGFSYFLFACYKIKPKSKMPRLTMASRREFISDPVHDPVTAAASPVHAPRGTRRHARPFALRPWLRHGSLHQSCAYSSPVAGGLTDASASDGVSSVAGLSFTTHALIDRRGNATVQYCSAQPQVPSTAPQPRVCPTQPLSCYPRVARAP